MTEADLKPIVLDGLRQIAPESNPESLSPDQNVREALDIDSFDFLNFLISINEKLGIEIPETDYGKLSTLRQMLTYLAAKCP